jgi:dipeptide transport system ATP-binding protein
VLSLFENPKSNYTKALLAALPENATGDRLTTVSAFFDGNPEPAPGAGLGVSA